MNNSHLAALGWDDWFESRARGGCDRAEDVARVAAVDRDQLLLLDGDGVFRGKLSGKFLHEAGAPLERPCVGDWVWVAKSAGEPFGVVHGVLERKGGLRRKAAGEAIEHQMIAANVDVVFIVQSCHFDFNVRRLERYLVMVRDGGATP
ncbi:MAG: ribosome small subunit-dependent GTPase A, partial [Thermoanaerobaculia bacterium]|nr:ribosome small subunit-dependent GTPase A [Thermoanaerobaculia bacterium]